MKKKIEVIKYYCDHCEGEFEEINLSHIAKGSNFRYFDVDKDSDFCAECIAKFLNLNI